MIGWVDAKMIMWGDYSMRRDDGGNGFPKDSPTCRLVGTSGNHGSMLIVESEALEIEAVMVEVKAARPELYAVGHAWYAGNRTATDIASRVRCHRDTVYSRLDSLHILVANRLSKSFAR